MANKEPNKKKKVTGKEFINKSRMIIGIALLACALFIGFAVLPGLSEAGEYKVYTLKQNVSEGTTITLSMLKETTTSDKTLAGLAVTKSAEKELGKYVASSYISKGSFLLWSDIKEADGSSVLDVVPAGKQIISVPVSSIYSSVSYSIAQGDVIRFYSTYNDEVGNVVSYIPSNLQYVLIHNVYDSSGIETSISGGAPSSISLIVTEAQALDIVKLINTSKVYYSLMSSGDPEKADSLLSQQEKILKGEAKASDEKVNISDIELSGSVNADVYTDNKASAGTRPN